MLNEYAWLPVLAPLLPLPIPVPQRLGQPTERYPRPWIVTTWVPGTPADVAPIAEATTAANALAGFLAALHQPAPADAPTGRQGRGGTLTQFAEGVAKQLEMLTELVTAAADATVEPRINTNAVRAIWGDALVAPGWEEPPLWLHGDLHPANVLTSQGDLSGVVDFGDLCAGDPALDLAAAWILLPDVESVERFRATNPLASDDATWRRARGWAVWRVIGCLRIATAGPPGGKPTWGPPAIASLQHLTAAVGSI